MGLISVKMLIGNYIALKDYPRVGVLQNVCIFFFKFFYIEVFSDHKIDKIKKNWLKKSFLKKASSYFSFRIKIQIKNKKFELD